MKTETRAFPTAVLASLSSGVLLCKFHDMHEAAEYLMGHPIWTHHFANKELWGKMRKTLLAQCPGLPLDMKDVTKENYMEHVASLEAELGALCMIRKGTGETAMHPLEGIPEGKPTIILQKN